MESHLVIYAFSQETAAPMTLREDLRRERRMLWLMLSKAAVGLRRMLRPESEEEEVGGDFMVKLLYRIIYSPI